MLKHSHQLTDYKGQHLCEACWNNQHYRHDGVVEQKRGKYVQKGQIVSNCDNAKLEIELAKLREEADHGNITKSRWDEVEEQIAKHEAVLKDKPCQCPCRQLLRDKPRKVKRDFSLQVHMFAPTVEKPQHRDEG